MNSTSASYIRECNHKSKTLRYQDPFNEDLAKKQFDEICQQVSANAITVCFTDIEGRFHMLDYDKDYLLESSDNLTFDGSSIRGFTEQCESDLRLHIDWGAVYLIPYHGILIEEDIDINKITVFGIVKDRAGHTYSSDFRGRLKEYLQELFNEGKRVHVAAEIEGFLFNDKDAEKKYQARQSFDFVNKGGYFDTLPHDSLRNFIDQAASVMRLCGFENEKDHPEVAPSQFEMNWKYTDALIAADQIQLYKVICRRMARNNGYTASFLPKPVTGVNGSGMHTNISLHGTNPNKNLFYDLKGEINLSEMCLDFIQGILHRAYDLCLICNPSVNSYRRLDPNMEAPNEIKASAIDRGSMIRIPIGNEKSARIELRTVAPDCNPYLMLFTVLKAGMAGPTRKATPDEIIKAVFSKDPHGLLPSNIYEAMSHFEKSSFIKDIIGPEVAKKYLCRKQASAERCPMALGTRVKSEEIIYHHEVTNQHLWTQF